MKAPKPKAPPPIIENIQAKHVFAQEELLEISRELGRTCTRIAVLESEKSSISKDYASRIETAEIQKFCLVDKVANGYEMRPTDCIVVMDPPNRSKDYFHLGKDGKKGEFIERREMRPADFQIALPIKEDGKKDKTVMGEAINKAMQKAEKADEVRSDDVEVPT